MKHLSHSLYKVHTPALSKQSFQVVMFHDSLNTSDNGYFIIYHQYVGYCPLYEVEIEVFWVVTPFSVVIG